MVGKLDSHVQKNETGTLSYTIHENQPKAGQNLNIRPESIKLLEENIGEELYNTHLVMISGT